MKKKLLAGFLSLLMVFTMASGIFAADTEEAKHIYPSYLPSVSLLDECPKCDYAFAYFYVMDGGVFYTCPACKASGTFIEPEEHCTCGTNCQCILRCDCGSYVTCGKECKNCDTVKTCGKNCASCRYFNKVDCVCAGECECLVLCECRRFTVCGTRCPSCTRYNYCGEDCTSCEAPHCECDCEEEECNCLTKCEKCDRYTLCGSVCYGCFEYVYCTEDCTFCNTNNWNPDWNPNWNPNWNPDWNPDWTPDWNPDWNPDYWYPILGYTCVCGKDCECLFICRTCYSSNLNFCGEFCRTCGSYIKCPVNCKTCGQSETPDLRYKVSVTQSFGGTYELTDGFYGTADQTKTLTIKAFPGYAIADVTINGEKKGSESTYELKMDRNYVISISFKKVGFTMQYTLQTNIIGSGSIKVTQNNVILEETATVTAAYKDTLYYYFVPTANHYIKDVKVNGKSVGAVSLYYVQGLTADTVIEVEFGWNNPYTDIAPERLAAVEFVTEKKLMSSYFTYYMTHLFKGDSNTSGLAFVTALAELADVKNELNTNTERLKWAVENGLIPSANELPSTVTAQTACEITAKFLETLEKKYSVTFNGDKAENTAKETCIALKLTTEEAYAANKVLTRYALAELLLGISKITYTK